MYQVREEEASGYNGLLKARDYFTTKSKTFRITQGEKHTSKINKITDKPRINQKL